MSWAPDYATPALVKSYLHITTTEADAFLPGWITTVSRNVDDVTGRQFGQTALETRVFTPVYSRSAGAYFAAIDDVMDVDDLVIVDENADVVTDYTLLPENALVKGKPYERIRVPGAGPYTIDAVWGWTPGTSGPAAASTGLLLQAARLNARRDSPFGISGSPSEQGEVRLLAQLDPDFRTSLKPFVRKWWAA